MRRRLFTIVSALTLLLCLAACVLLVRRYGVTISGWTVSIPLRAIAVIVAVPTVFWILRRRTLHPAGHCAACGYDVRATPERCPECGAIPAGAAK